MQHEFRVPAFALLAENGNSANSSAKCFFALFRLIVISLFPLKYIDDNGGPLADIETGEIFSDIQHKGIHNFTIGKRLRRDNCSGSMNALLPHGDALYVADIDPLSRTVFLVSFSKPTESL